MQTSLLDLAGRMRPAHFFAGSGEDMSELDPTDTSLRDTLLRLERLVWDALRSGDVRADQAALAPDFLGVYPDGFAGRDDHVAQLARGPTIQDYDLADLHARTLGPDFALLSYRATFRRIAGDMSEVMYVSSIWRRDGEAWMNIFSQDTVAAAPTGDVH